MRSVLLRRVALLFALLMPALASALTLPPIFGDRMVLQQGKPVPVWGEAVAGARIRVEFAGQTKTAIASASGAWQVVLEPLPASAEARELSVRATGTESAERAFRDVLVGEVWLCSGQSNMFWPVGEIANARSRWPGIANGEAEVAQANWPEIRLNCADDHEFGLGGWRVCMPENVRGFSATAYFFGRELHRRLGVPVGLINRSLGGTSLQAWTPKPELEALAFVARNARFLAEAQPRIQAWNREFAAFRKAVADGTAPRPQRPEPLPDDIETARKLQNHGELHERHIAPLVPFALRGNIWYQGESNAAPAALAAAYGDMLAALIAGRRRLWAEPALPFHFVQLPIFAKPASGEHWHVVREGMRRTQQRTPHTGMAVIYDFSDPSLLHPPEKQEVGRRLALWALAKEYGQSVDYSGPLFRDARFAGGAATVTFDHARGLRGRDGRPLRGFELAGADGVFRAGRARIEDDTVVVTSPQVPQPRQVRFFFGGHDAPNLVNAAGLPASPFTTGEF
jgi:sialate O-acetylesterase